MQDFMWAKLIQHEGLTKVVDATAVPPEGVRLVEGMDILATMIHNTSKSKGFWKHEDVALSDGREVPNPSITAEKLALIHSEVSEALEAWRDGNGAEVEAELADVIIRVLDLAAANGYSMDMAVREKMLKNADRPYLHGRGR